MSLYRKYRPHTFADVSGQEHVVTTLEQAAKHDKLAHAYLFAGSRGTGKTSIARILARILMTRGIEDATVQAQVEKGVDDGSIVDLLEIDAASNRGIDDIRDLIEKIQFSPVVASAKVYIIDEVHMLTKEAFNALLKTLEEPPSYAYFILATTELNKIPDTIQSRCQCFPFRHIREEDIVQRLQFIADQEHISIDRNAIRAIAHASNGGMRDAISLLDQLRSLEHIAEADVHHRIGASGYAYVEDVLQSIENHDSKQLLQAIAQVEDAGVSLDVFVRYLLKLTREALHTALEESQDITSYVQRMDVLLNALRDMRISPVPGLVLEAALLSLCSSQSTPHIPSPTEQKRTNTTPKSSESVEKPSQRDHKQSDTSSQDKEPTSREKNIPEKSTPVFQAPEISFDAVKKAWSDIVAQVSPPSVKMSLKNGRVTALKGNTVSVSFSSAFHRDKVKSAEGSRAVEELLEKHFASPLSLLCILDGEANHAPTSSAEDDVVNLADAAAEIF